MHPCLSWGRNFCCYAEVDGNKQLGTSTFLNMKQVKRFLRNSHNVCLSANHMRFRINGVHAFITKYLHWYRNPFQTHTHTSLMLTGHTSSTQEIHCSTRELKILLLLWYIILWNKNYRPLAFDIVTGRNLRPLWHSQQLQNRMTISLQNYCWVCTATTSFKWTRRSVFVARDMRDIPASVDF